MKLNLLIDIKKGDIHGLIELPILDLPDAIIPTSINTHLFIPVKNQNNHILNITD